MLRVGIIVDSIQQGILALKNIIENDEAEVIKLVDNSKNDIFAVMSDETEYRVITTSNNFKGKCFDQLILVDGDLEALYYMVDYLIRSSNVPEEYQIQKYELKFWKVSK